MKSVYVIIANEEEKVKECFVVEDKDLALRTFDRLKAVWGVANVAFISRQVGWVGAPIDEHIQPKGVVLKWLL